MVGRGRHTKLGDAVSYTLNQSEYLTRYVEDGRMPIDNHLLERDIRDFATGRKSWLLCDTVGGARASAVTYSLMLTCRACGVEPLAWLRHVLTELPSDLTTPISTTCCRLTLKDTPNPPTSLRWPVSSSVNYDGRSASRSNVLRNARLRLTG
jgi:hypothetical protein